MPEFNDPTPSESTDTELMIRAVLANEATPGERELLSRWSTRSGASRHRSKVGAFVATAAGKLVLCTAVAAATVGGAYTTGAIDVETGGDAPAPSVAPPAADDGPAVTSTSSVRPPVVTDTAIPPVAGGTVDQVEASDEGTGPTDADARGCEFGQATAAAASEGAEPHREGDGPPHDPCTRSERETGAVAPGGGEIADDPGNNGTSGAGNPGDEPGNNGNPGGGNPGTGGAGDNRGNGDPGNGGGRRGG